MDFNLTKEQKIIINEVKNFSSLKLNDNVFDDDDNSRFPIEKWKMCGEMGIMSLPVPEEYDGGGEGILTTSLAIKALAAGCKDEGLIFSICAHLCTFMVPLMDYGTREQKDVYLNSAASGTMIGGNGISEANAGSDNSLMETRVEKENDAFILNGAKLFVTNGPVADALVIFGKHPGGMKGADISAFIMTKEQFTVGQHFEKMGLRTSPLSEIVLQNSRLTGKSLLGRERLGMVVFNSSMLWERIIMSAYHIGAMERQYDTVLEYANERSQFGSKISTYQYIADKLVGMKTKIELSALLLYKTCWKFDTGQIDMSDAALLKLYVSEAAKENSLEAVNIFAGYGYLKESMIEKDLRDSISSTIYSGTSEVQKNIIAKTLGKYHE